MGRMSISSENLIRKKLRNSPTKCKMEFMTLIKVNIICTYYKVYNLLKMV